MSTIIADNLTGKTAAGNVTVTSEGGATTFQLQQGLAKFWSRFNPATNAVFDSLNQSSRTDLGTGVSRSAFTSSMSNDDFATVCQTSNASEPVNDSTGAYISSTHNEATTYVEFGYGFSGHGTGTEWFLNDYPNIKGILQGDLA